MLIGGGFSRVDGSTCYHIAAVHGYDRQFSPLAITSASPLPAGTIGVAYSETLTVSGGQPPYGWAINTGQLPDGLTLSSTGVLSGAPTNAGDFNFSVQVTDSSNAIANKTLALNISHPSQIDQARLGYSFRDGNQLRLQFTAYYGQPYALEFRASLAPGDWEPLTNISAQPITVNITVTDLVSGNSRFYRIRSP